MDDIERWRLLTLVFGFIEPEKFNLLIKDMAEVDATRKVYCFPLGVQGTSCPHAHFFGSCYISDGVGINLFSLLIRGFSGPNETDWQRHRYPAFFLCINQLILVASSLGVCWR